MLNLMTLGGYLPLAPQVTFVQIVQNMFLNRCGTPRSLMRLTLTEADAILCLREAEYATPRFFCSAIRNPAKGKR